MKPEKKTIILHIGMHKTGTTSIQHTLYYERNKLLNYGIIYASSLKPNHSDLMFYSFWDRDISHWKWEINQSNIDEVRKAAINRFKETVSDFILSDKSHLIFSAETLSRFPENSLKNLVDTITTISPDINIIPVLCTRNPIEYNTSFRQQRLKNSRPPLKIDICDFRNKLGNLYKCFSKENIIIYSFEEAKKHKSGLVGCFLEKTGFSEELFDELNILRRNESISNICIDIINYINSHDPLFLESGLSRTRYVKDGKPLLAIRGDKFKLKSTEFSQIIDDLKKDAIFLKENTGIDYLSYIDNYSKYTCDNELFYPETFAEDIERVYFLLNRNIRHYVKIYLKRQLTVIKDPVSLSNLKDAYDTIVELNKIKNCYKIVIKEDLKSAKRKVKLFLRNYNL